MSDPVRHEHRLQQALDRLGSRSDVRAHTDVFAGFSESAGNVVVDVSEQHSVQQLKAFEIEGPVDRSGEIARHAGQVLRFVDLSKVHVTGNLNGEQNLLGLLECQRRVLDGVRIEH